MAKVDKARLDELVSDGYLTCRTHPENLGLFIWNYTPKCQFERYWVPETMMCRGLITTFDGTIVARPFKKFLNVEEHGPDNPLDWDRIFEVSEKIDGSLAILFWHNDVPYIATRGSFESEQAIAATKLFRERYGDLRLNHNYTYLFEYLAPWNRVVVDYGKREDLVLLAIFNTETGWDVPIFSHWTNVPFPVAKRYNFQNAEQIERYMKKHDLDGEEGFVLCFADGTRAKWKFASYVRLHKILTNTNARTIWETLRTGESIHAFLENVPDEFYLWVARMMSDLTKQYVEIERICRAGAAAVIHLKDRKAIAATVKTYQYPAIVFKMLDGKDYRDAIWKLIRPKAEKPFRKESEEVA